jgi:hypothetical protein
VTGAPKSLGRIAPVFRVENLERALAWYQEKPGFVQSGG